MPCFLKNKEKKKKKKKKGKNSKIPLFQSWYWIWSKKETVLDWQKLLLIAVWSSRWKFYCITSQQTHNVEMSIHCWFNVLMLNQRWIFSTLCACWVCSLPSVLEKLGIDPHHTFSWRNIRTVCQCLSGGIGNYFLRLLTFTTVFTTLWANSDDKLMIFFLIFPRKQDLTFHVNCLHCIIFHILFSGKNKEIFQNVACRKFFPAC